METKLKSTLQLDRAFVRAADSALKEAFGRRFDLWAVADSQYQLLSEEPSASTDPPPGVATLLERSLETNLGPLVSEEAAGDSILSIPICRDGVVVLVATAIFETPAPELLIRLAQLFLREFSQREQLERQRGEKDTWATELTNNYEELVFLRSMAQYLELSDVSHGFAKLAETVLPLLRNAINAESLVLVAAQDDGQSRNTANVKAAGPIMWSGPELTDGETCCRLVQQYQHSATEQPVVKNGFQQMPEGSAFRGIHEFLLVPVTKADRVMAWLLALNRRKRCPSRLPDERWQLSQNEFGTVEAGLAGSTASILATHASNVELLRERERLLVSVVRSLVSAIEARDSYKRGHSGRVALFAKRLGRELGLSKEACERLYLAGLLHDLGIIGVSESILRKPARLTDEEYAEIKRHPKQGRAILYDLEQLRYVLPGVVHHHEHYDGRGYPDGLQGEEISWDGRILSVVDAYDAMTSDRPYRKRMPQEKAEAIIREGAGSQWDPQVVETFLRVMPDMVKLGKSC